jgi:AcrR family transcriptional regulator
MSSTQSRGTKRDEILAAATERFGRDGYEDTKWADIAADVGVGRPRCTTTSSQSSTACT